MGLLSTVVGIGGKLLGGVLGNKSERRALDWQKEYARNRIQMTVKDAEKAGIHPLAALGSSAAGSLVSGPMGGNSLGDAIGDAAAGVSRAAEARQERLHELELQRVQSETDKNNAEAYEAIATARSRSIIDMLRKRATDVDSRFVTGDGRRTVIHDPLIGMSDMHAGPSNDELEAEIGGLADWITGARYIDGWLRSNWPKARGSDLWGSDRPAGMGRGGTRRQPNYSQPPFKRSR